MGSIDCFKGEVYYHLCPFKRENQEESLTVFKGRPAENNCLSCLQERVNSFPPAAPRSPPVSVSDFQPPYFPPPFSTAMALQQAHHQSINQS